MTTFPAPGAARGRSCDLGCGVAADQALVYRSSTGDRVAVVVCTACMASFPARSILVAKPYAGVGYRR